MNVDRHVIAGVGQRCRGFDRRVVFDNDAQRQDMAEARWRQKDAQPLSFLERAVGLRTEYGEDLLDLVRRGAEIVQDRAHRVVFLGDHDVLVVVARGGRLRLAQKRDVHRHDARLKAEIRIGLIVGRIAQPQRTGAVGTGRCRRAEASVLGDIAHALHDLVERQERRAPHLRQQRTQLTSAGCGLGTGRRCGEVASRERHFGSGCGVAA